VLIDTSPLLHMPAGTHVHIISYAHHLDESCYILQALVTLSVIAVYLVQFSSGHVWLVSKDYLLF